MQPDSKDLCCVYCFIKSELDETVKYSRGTTDETAESLSCLISRDKLLQEKTKHFLILLLMIKAFYTKQWGTFLQNTFKRYETC